MAWTIDERFPSWGEVGTSPSSGFFYEGGDQVNEKHLDYLWNSVNGLEEDIQAALNDLDSDGDGVVDEAALARAATGPFELADDLAAAGGEVIWDESASHIPRDRLDIPSMLVENPDKLPIAQLDAGESIEIPVRVPDTETLEVYRWGAYDAADGTAPTGLDVELVDGGDVVQASANTANTENKTTTVASHTNISGSLSVFKVRAYNGTGAAINSPGVGAHFGFRVV